MYAKIMQHFRMIKGVRPPTSTADNMASKGRDSWFKLYGFLWHFFVQMFIGHIFSHIDSTIQQHNEYKFCKRHWTYQHIHRVTYYCFLKFFL